jgi:acetyl-CoA carboxylase / biotin carboxylase 1
LALEIVLGQKTHDRSLSIVDRKKKTKKKQKKIVQSKERMSESNGNASSSSSPTTTTTTTRKHRNRSTSMRGATMQEYVRALGGKRAIETLLLANNGIAAVKAIKSMRQWAYSVLGDECAIRFVAMATPEDIEANAEYIRMADEFQEVPGGANNNNYANVQLIVDLAQRCNAQGVWAGWGHASENPKLPAALAQCGIAFLGPPSGAMRDLGDKIASTIIGQCAGVPCVPWSGSHVRVDYISDGISERAYEQATVRTFERARLLIEGGDGGAEPLPEPIGYPVMIKASEGGGGKGIRKVVSGDGLEAAFRAVQAEVPGSPIFIMRMVSDCHHLEVQIIGDEYGEAIALYSRDCSVQRRHQKIIEEGPVIAAPPRLMRQMERAAVRMAKAVRYVGAGTIEYLYSPALEEYYFLELNPRLQVEHPVTEQITDINLPATQLHIAMGVPLERIPDVRAFYGEAPLGAEPIDFASREPLPPRGHVIAVRITAENPAAGFKPTSGAIQELTFRTVPNVWGYFSVGAVGGLHEFADSQFGHLFAWGENRGVARKNMLSSLRELSIRGEIHTPIEFLIPLMETTAFQRCEVSTEWLDGLIASDSPIVDSRRQPAFHQTVALYGAIYKTAVMSRAREEQFWSHIERGQMPPPDLLMPSHRIQLIFDGVRHNFVVLLTGPNSLTLFTAHTCDEGAAQATQPPPLSAADDVKRRRWAKVCAMLSDAAAGGASDETIDPSSAVDAEFRSMGDGGLLVVLDGRTHVCYGREEAIGLRLTVNRLTYILPNDFDPTALRATTPGKLVRYLVADGSHVAAGAAYAEIEVMKMYLPLVSPEAGRVQLLLPEGAVLAAGDLIGRLELDDPSSVKKVLPFAGRWPPIKPPRAPELKLHHRFRAVCQRLRHVIAGYVRSGIKRDVEFVLAAASTPQLPVLQFREVLSVLAARLPPKLVVTIDERIDALEATVGNILPLALSASSGGSDGGEGSAAAATSTRLSSSLFDDVPSSPTVQLMFRHRAAAAAAAVAAAAASPPLNEADEASLVRIEQQVDEAVLAAIGAVRDAVAGERGALASADDAARFDALSAPIAELIARYSDGLRGHVNYLIAHFLREYLDVEQHFQLRSREEIYEQLRDAKQSKESVVGMVLSRSQISRKTDLVLHLLNSVGASQRTLDTHETIIRQLSRLNGASNTEVSLHARQLLIRHRLPSFEQRRELVERQLRAALGVDGAEQRIVALEPLIGHTRPLVNVICAFFLHAEAPMRNTALEVYIRRCYRAYDIRSFEPHAARQERYCCAHWTFRLPDHHESRPPSPSPPPMRSVDADSLNVGGGGDADSSSTMSTFRRHKRNRSMLSRPESVDRDLFALGNAAAAASVADDASQQSSVPAVLTRYGMVAVTRTLDDLDACIDDILAEFEPAATEHHGQPINVLCVVLMEASGVDGNERAFCQRVTALLGGARSVAMHEVGVRRVTALVANNCARGRTGFPQSFTFRARAGFAEDPIYRNIEPSLAHHLELDRLSNYDIQLFPTEDRQIHLYYAVNKGETAKNPRLRDERFFSRALVRQPDDAVTAAAAAAAAEQQPQAASSAQKLLASANDLEQLRINLTREQDTLLSEIERVLVESIRALEIAVSTSGGKYARSQNHHIFLRILPEIVLEPEKIGRIIHMFGQRYGRRLWRLRCFELELALRLRPDARTAGYVPVRFIVKNPSGYQFHVYLYLEIKDRLTDEVRLFAVEDWGLERGELDDVSLTRPYPVIDALQRRRFMAQSTKTTYVYDFPELFGVAVRQLWIGYNRQFKGGVLAAERLSSSSAPPRVVPFERRYACGDVMSRELVLTDDGSALRELAADEQREPGVSDVGMVAWRLTLSMPECPDGRDVVVIANDITHEIGSFGPREDLVFQRASEYARAHGLPRIYLSANSGARIGLAREIKALYRVAWKDDADPTRGFDYLYLSDVDYQRLCAEHGAGVVACRRVVVDRDGEFEVRHRIDTIVGSSDGIGVENLRGSGTIAGETSRAYDEIFTITLVTGRSVGIGAYLVRLGQRTVQNEAPLLLTGAHALNKVLGREVYSSNVQLGGPQIMFNNGVSHLDVHDELKGVVAILRWISYVPVRRHSLLSLLPSVDPVERDVGVVPTAMPYDPRLFLAGSDYYQSHDAANSAGDRNGNAVDDDDDDDDDHDRRQPIATSSSSSAAAEDWLGGVFDRGSFMETLAGWARTVVCGRARLGGIPVGVIAVETRTIDRVIPADPANPESQQTVVQQPGQVWFPNSAYKTAQAIRDINREQLPLIIFANWRGFSGGMRDMFDEILKYGSYIVDALCEYRQPVLVYIPPAGELRGGAWVVVDPTINGDMMEMYADENSRGGVLEPTGTVEIKYRIGDIRATIRRLDATVLDWQRELDELSASSPDAATPAIAELRRRIGERVAKLAPIYQQIAISFADLHDTPGRMKAKGVIDEVLVWRQCRFFLYARLRRRLAEEHAKRQIAAIDASLTAAQRTDILRTWLAERQSAAGLEPTRNEPMPNIAVARFLENIDENAGPLLKSLRTAAIDKKLTGLLEASTDDFVAALANHLPSFTDAQRQQLSQLFQ